MTIKTQEQSKQTPAGRAVPLYVRTVLAENALQGFCSYPSRPECGGPGGFLAARQDPCETAGPQQSLRKPSCLTTALCDVSPCHAKQHVHREKEG